MLITSLKLCAMKNIAINNLLRRDVFVKLFAFFNHQPDYVHAFVWNNNQQG